MDVHTLVREGPVGREDLPERVALGEEPLPQELRPLPEDPQFVGDTPPQELVRGEVAEHVSHRECRLVQVLRGTPADPEVIEDGSLPQVVQEPVPAELRREQQTPTQYLGPLSLRQ